MTEAKPRTKAAAKPAPAAKPKPTGLDLLRVPFEPHQIGKLPKPFFKDSPKQNCRECGGYHGFPCAHIDYVGHAALTDRLLDADPEWNWEPVSRDQFGQPLIMNGGLWIKLTVCGVTRLGYGDTGGKGGPNGVKEAIGDALRNAAMRFGAALDLWHKGDLHAFKEEQGYQQDDLPERDVNQEPAAPPQAPVSDQTPGPVQPSTPPADSAQGQPPRPAQNVIYEGTTPVPVEVDIPALAHEFEETVMAALTPEARTELGKLWKQAGLPNTQAFRTKAQVDKAWELYERVKPAPMPQPTYVAGQNPDPQFDAAASQLQHVREARREVEADQARRAFYGSQTGPDHTEYPEPDYP